MLTPEMEQTLWVEYKNNVRRGKGIRKSKRGENLMKALCACIEIPQ
jgi:hypothetical protein